MSNVLDLSLLVKEPITIKFGEEESFTIPAEPSLEFVAKIVDYEERAKKSKTNKEQFNLLIELAKLILSQDDSKRIDDEFINKLSPSQINAIVRIYQQRVTDNLNNPN